MTRLREIDHRKSAAIAFGKPSSSVDNGGGRENCRRDIADAVLAVYIQGWRRREGGARSLLGQARVGKKAKSRFRKHPRRTFLGRVRAYFLAGVLVTAPLGITLWLTWGIITFFDSKVVPLIPAHYNPETYLPVQLPGLGLLLAFVVLVLIGWIAAGLFGRWLVRMSERLLNQMPVVRNVYSAVKQIMETVLAQNASAFRYVVLVEYPRRGIWTMGFVTGGTDGEVQNVVDAELVNVFIPTTPNPTSGFLLFVPKKDLYYLDMSSEEGFKMLVSTGIVTPPDRRSEERRSTPMIKAGNEALAARSDPPADVLSNGKITKWKPTAPGTVATAPVAEDQSDRFEASEAEASEPERSVNRS